MLYHINKQFHQQNNDNRRHILLEYVFVWNEIKNWDLNKICKYWKQLEWNVKLMYSEE